MQPLSVDGRGSRVKVGSRRDRERETQRGAAVLKTAAALMAAGLVEAEGAVLQKSTLFTGDLPTF